MQSMCCEHDGAPSEQPADAVSEDRRSHVRVNSSKDVVKKDDISIPIDGTSEADTGLLTATEADSLLANLSKVSSGKQGNIWAQLTSVESRLVPRLIEGTPKEDICSQARVQNKRNLRGVGDRPSHSDSSSYLGQLPENGLQEAAFSGPHPTNNARERTTWHSPRYVLEG
jgi:hypothetical protein